MATPWCLARMHNGATSLPPTIFPSSNTTQTGDSSLGHLCGDGDETWRWQLLSAGAVPTALHTVEDLLLQFLSLLLLLGKALGHRLAGALVAVQDFAVLGVPQVGVHAARGAEERFMVAALFHLTLSRQKKEKKCPHQNALEKHTFFRESSFVSRILIIISS